LVALLGVACARSVEQPTDGQTHWMESCESDSECGELSCVCGACTAVCNGSNGCELDDSVCAPTGQVFAQDACDRTMGDVRVCVPACERQSDCDAIADDLTCSGEVLCAREEAIAMPPDSSTPEQDASTPEPDAGERDGGGLEPPLGDPIEVACDDGGDLLGEGFEILATSTFVPNFVIAPDGTIYSRFEGETGLTGIVRVNGSDEPEPFAPSIYNVVSLVMDRDALFVVINDNGDETRIAHVDRDTEEVTYLAREPAMNPRGIVFDSESIYWSAQISQDPYVTRVFKSPREPGETQMLAELEGDAHSLVRIGDVLYTFVGTDEEDARLQRIPTDGSPLEVLDDGPTELAAMFSDGTSLFVVTGGGLDDLGNNTNDARIHQLNLETLALEDFYPAGRGSLFELILSDDFMYWVMDENRETEGGHAAQTVWRANKDGSGQAERLADVTGWAQPIAAHGDDLYWMGACRLQPQRHIVRIPLR
jgi:hypothetical protein